MLGQDSFMVSRLGELDFKQTSPQSNTPLDSKTWARRVQFLKSNIFLKKYYMETPELGLHPWLIYSVVLNQLTNIFNRVEPPSSTNLELIFENEIC